MKVQEINNTNIMKKVLFIICITLFSVATFAQGDFRVEIKQVFPKSSLVYSNAFNFKREMDNAIASKTAELRAKNANYKIFIKTPSGNETRPIQNIVWIETINGKKSYHQKKTSPSLSSSYKVPTMWQGYACTVDGTQKGAVTKVDFIYRVSIVGGTNEFETGYVSLENARIKAKKAFAESKAIDRLIEVVIYKDKEKMEEETLSNKKEYLAFENEQKHTVDSLEAIRKEQLSMTNGSVEKFKKDLKYIQDKKESLKKEGVRHCRIALEETARVIPDSTFTSERLDSIYNTIFTNDVLSGTKNKAVKVLLNELQSKRTISDPMGAKAVLLYYTKQIEAILFPLASKEIVVEDAYKKVIPTGIKPYQFEINGVNFSFYEEKANEGILVNEKTKEYEVGTFEPVRGADNKFVYHAKKVKKYARDGKKMH